MAGIKRIGGMATLVVAVRLLAACGGSGSGGTGDAEAGVDGAVREAATGDVASDTAGDARVDASGRDAFQCATDQDCGDGVFCDGVERCAPGAAGADARGCVAALTPACPADAGVRCDEAQRACVSDACANPDEDGDHVRSIACGGNDCDDHDAMRFPGNAEVCDPNGHDEDCDPCTVAAPAVAGTVTDGDADGDGYDTSVCSNLFVGATPRCDTSADRIAGNRVTGSDCNDSNPNVHPNQTEACNGADDNCNGATDEGIAPTDWHADCDGDNFGSPTGATVSACSAPSTPPACGGSSTTGQWVSNAGDCDDTSVAVNPAAAEQCNGVDDNCNGVSDDADVDATAACGTAPGATLACNGTACVVADCLLGRADCDGVESTGCECVPPDHASSACNGTGCGFACDPGYHACGAACADDTQPATCGSSCTPCPAPAHGSATCVAGACGIACDPDYVLAGGACVQGPRPIAPLSTGTATTWRPTFEWELGAGTVGARVEVCSDRACTARITQFDVMGTRGASPTDLRIYGGMLYWRLHPINASGATTASSPTWPLVIRNARSTVNNAFGSMLDLNGDGRADVVVGAANVYSGTGRAYVYLSQSGTITSTPSVTLDAPDGAGSGFGNRIAPAGDVNGDGYADLIVAKFSGASPAAYVYHGGPGGIASTPTTTLTGFGGAVRAVASAGDVNRDGYADVIVGALSGYPFYDDGAYLFLGGPAGLSRTPSKVLRGQQYNTSFGAAVGGGGDVDGDGYCDVFVSASGENSSTGTVYVYRGGPTGLADTASATITGPTGANGYFGYALAGGGDVNGDGYADLIVSGSGGTTSAYLYHGSPTGLSSTPSVTLSGPAGSGFGSSLAFADFLNSGYSGVLVGASVINVQTGAMYAFAGGPSGASTTAIGVINGSDGQRASFGYAVAGAGDVNADGYEDVLVGANGALSSRGKAYLYSGGPPAGLFSTAAASLTGPDAGTGSFGQAVAQLPPRVGSPCTTPPGVSTVFSRPSPHRSRSGRPVAANAVTRQGGARRAARGM